jgi:hypothetical protein
VNYRPQLNSIRVPLNKLLLDPNNPRFLEDHSDRVKESDFADSGVQQAAAERMKKEAFHLEDLKKSIVSNGWQPVDMIFVRKIDALPGHFVVLEGNRRLMALRQLMGKLPKETAEAVDPLYVLEVVGTPDVEESRAQITYLLGVRHHGSLKTWGPFAQAHDLYERYLRLGRMTDASFKWVPKIAEKIGEKLSLDAAKIQERIRVYRAMKQLHNVPEIQGIGVEGKYYSLVKEALPAWQSKNPLKSYITQDPTTFNLDDESLRRMDALCHFSVEGRQGAPISSPDEWRPVAKILADPDPEERTKMLRAIEVEKKTPSDVAAKRQAELRHPRWDRWLIEVADLLKRLQIANVDADDQQAKLVCGRLAAILDVLPSASNASIA